MSEGLQGAACTLMKTSSLPTCKSSQVSTCKLRIALIMFLLYEGKTTFFISTGFGLADNYLLFFKKFANQV